jgi:signal transduction histidine kinase
LTTRAAAGRAVAGHRSDAEAPEILAPEERHFILSAVPPGPAQKRLAAVVVSGLLLVFASLTAGLLSGIETRRVDAFLPAYLAAMFVCDSITAILLFAQFSIMRSRATLFIASAYLFTALILIPYGLAFPGAFAPAGVIGGLQTAASLYVVWHCGFPLLVTAYALSKDRGPGARLSTGATGAAIARSVALTSALVLASTLVCTAGERLLPAIMLDPVTFGPDWPYLVGTPIAMASICALIVLWARRRSALDLWLWVVMFLYLMEVPLSYYPVPMRFSAGWYAVRVLGFLSSSLVLIVLLYEIQTLYARLLAAVLALRRSREARLMTGEAVAASIVHEVRQPLTAMVTTADAGLRFLDRPIPGVDLAREAFRRITADGHRAAALIGTIRANFKADVRHQTPVDINEVVRQAIALGRAQLQRHRIVVHAQTSERLPEIRGNRFQLQQVLLNLIMNAVDAMAAKDGPRILSVRSESHEGDRILVSVADTGTGVRSQDVDRIFNPLFTTKSDGMGMGLSICRAIVEAHHGQLWYAPNSPRGAVFRFTLRSRI